MAKQNKAGGPEAEAIPAGARRGFAPGDKVKLADGRTGQLVARAKDAYPPGWVVEGVKGAVPEASLEPTDDQA